jgi:hypothetical protein
MDARAGRAAQAAAESRLMLAAFQDRFVRTLLEPELPAPPAFAVYRNTVIKGCIDALQANYPAVARLVGDEWFRAAAAIYVRANPPRAPMLVEYGERFPVFLETFGPAAELPYLPAVARLDRFWSECHLARDEAPLRRIEKLPLRIHAAARWAWFPLPAFSIWSRTREGDADLGDLAWRAEGALLTRPHDAVRWMALDAAGCALLDACARGETPAMNPLPFLEAGAFAQP